MTTIVTHICDRCKQQMKQADSIQVGFIVSAYNSRYFANLIPQARNVADWCRDCVTAMDLNHTANDFPVAPLSVSEQLEEIIKSIVKEAIEDQS